MISALVCHKTNAHEDVQMAWISAIAWYDMTTYEVQPTSIGTT